MMQKPPIKNMDKKKQDQIINLEEKVSHLDDQLKRAVADYHNLEKRVEENALLIGDYARSRLITNILPVLDSLDQAVSGASESEAKSAWLQGVLMSIKELRQVLSEEGLVEIPTDQCFDPKLHEAVDVIEGKDGKIEKVTLRGYTLNDKVLRPAKVIVGKSESSNQNQELSKEKGGSDNNEYRN